MLVAACVLVAGCAFSAYEEGRRLMMAGDLEGGLAKEKQAAIQRHQRFEWIACATGRRRAVVALEQPPGRRSQRHP